MAGETLSSKRVVVDIFGAVSFSAAAGRSLSEERMLEYCAAAPVCILRVDVVNCSCVGLCSLINLSSLARFVCVSAILVECIIIHIYKL